MNGTAIPKRKKKKNTILYDFKKKKIQSPFKFSYNKREWHL